jgi:hypothetical protein
MARNELGDAAMWRGALGKEGDGFGYQGKVRL